MLTITIKAIESFDNETERFVYIGEDYTIDLEHSLVSLSKWETTWEKPFLSDEPRTTEEVLGYIKAMTLTPGIPDEAYERLTSDNMTQINDYIGRKMTATWFNEKPGEAKGRREIVTSELVYYWLTAYQIPFSAETWHLNRLFTLIKIANEKNKPQKQQRMSRRELAAQRTALNNQRRAQLGTSG